MLLRNRYFLCFLSVGTAASPFSFGHGDPESAIAELNAIISEAPESAALYLRRARSFEESANWAAAIADLQKATDLGAKSLDLTRELARVRLEAGELVQARTALDEFLAQAPNDAEARVLRARARTQLGQTQEAYSDYTRAIELIAEPRPELYLARAMLPVEPTLALSGLDEGIARLGTIVSLQERAITLDLRLNRLDSALSRIDKLTSVSERKEIWLYQRAKILAEAGRTADAREAGAQAIAAIRSLPSWLQNSSSTQQLLNECNALTSPSS